MISKNMSFTSINEQGEAVQYEVLLVFESCETRKNYVIFTDRQLDENGNENIYASAYIPDSTVFALQSIETEKEWELIKDALDDMQASPSEERSQTMSFTVVNAQGKGVQYEALLMLECTEIGKNYVIYTNHERDENGNRIVYASAYVPDSTVFVLQSIETEKEWTFIKEALNDMQARLREEKEVAN